MIHPLAAQMHQVAIVYDPQVAHDVFEWMRPGMGRVLTPNLYKHIFYFEKDFERAVERSCDFARTIINRKIDAL